MNNINTFKQKAKNFIDDNYGWGLLILGIIALILIIGTNTITHFLSNIFNEGYNSESVKKRISKSTYYSLGRILGCLFYYIASSGLVGLLFGGVFYRFFLKFILRDT